MEHAQMFDRMIASTDVASMEGRGPFAVAIAALSFLCDCKDTATPELRSLLRQAQEVERLLTAADASLSKDDAKLDAFLVYTDRQHTAILDRAGAKSKVKDADMTIDELLAHGMIMNRDVVVNPTLVGKASELIFALFANSVLCEPLQTSWLKLDLDSQKQYNTPDRLSISNRLLVIRNPRTRQRQGASHYNDIRHSEMFSLINIISDKSKHPQTTTQRVNPEHTDDDVRSVSSSQHQSETRSHHEESDDDHAISGVQDIQTVLDVDMYKAVKIIMTSERMHAATVHFLNELSLGPSFGKVYPFVYKGSRVLWHPRYLRRLSNVIERFVVNRDIDADNSRTPTHGGDIRTARHTRNTIIQDEKTLYAKLGEIATAMQDAKANAQTSSTGRLAFGSSTKQQAGQLKDQKHSVADMDRYKSVFDESLLVAEESFGDLAAMTLGLIRRYGLSMRMYKEDNALSNRTSQIYSMENEMTHYLQIFPTLDSNLWDQSLQSLDGFAPEIESRQDVRREFDEMRVFNEVRAKRVADQGSWHPRHMHYCSRVVKELMYQLGASRGRLTLLSAPIDGKRQVVTFEKYYQYWMKQPPKDGASESSPIAIVRGRLYDLFPRCSFYTFHAEVKMSRAESKTREKKLRLKYDWKLVMDREYKNAVVDCIEHLGRQLKYDGNHEVFTMRDLELQLLREDVKDQIKCMEIALNKTLATMTSHWYALDAINRGIAYLRGQLGTGTGVIPNSSFDMDIQHAHEFMSFVPCRSPDNHPLSCASKIMYHADPKSDYHARFLSKSERSDRMKMFDTCRQQVLYGVAASTLLRFVYTFVATLPDSSKQQQARQSLTKYCSDRMSSKIFYPLTFVDSRSALERTTVPQQKTALEQSAFSVLMDAPASASRGLALKAIMLAESTSAMIASASVRVLFNYVATFVAKLVWDDILTTCIETARQNHSIIRATTAKGKDAAKIQSYLENKNKRGRVENELQTLGELIQSKLTSAVSKLADSVYDTRTKAQESARKRAGKFDESTLRVDVHRVVLQNLRKQADEKSDVLHRSGQYDTITDTRLTDRSIQGEACPRDIRPREVQFDYIVDQMVTTCVETIVRVARMESRNSNVANWQNTVDAGVIQCIWKTMQAASRYMIYFVDRIHVEIRKTADRSRVMQFVDEFCNRRGHAVEPFTLSHVIDVLEEVHENTWRENFHRCAYMLRGLIDNRKLPGWIHEMLYACTKAWWVQELVHPEPAFYDRDSVDLTVGMRNVCTSVLTQVCIL